MSARRRKPKSAGGSSGGQSGGGQNGGRQQGGGGQKGGTPRSASTGGNRRPTPRRTGQDAAPDRTNPIELFAVVPSPPTVQRITPADEPSSMVRSLGTPPLTGQAGSALGYLSAVVERASGLASALAAANDLLDLPTDDSAAGSDPTDGV